MACYACEFKGFIESSTMRDNRVVPIILQCNSCRDTKAYSARVMQKHAAATESTVPSDYPSNVIPFPGNSRPRRPQRWPAQVIPIKGKRSA